MKRTFLFIACMLTSLAMPALGSEMDYSDYLPFVRAGKTWHVVRSDFGSGHHLNKYTLTNEEVVRQGKTYLRMNYSEDDPAAVYDAGLVREEDRKVYVFDTDMQKEYLVFDYSLKAGDTYETYSADEQKTVSYTVLSVGNYTKGPKVKYLHHAEDADSMAIHQRYLRKWTVCRTDDNAYEKTWIEGVGSLEGPFSNLYDSSPISSRDYLAYVEYGIDDNIFLPFPFYDQFSQIHGCELPKTADYPWETGSRHQLIYELEGSRLHVYGKVFTHCGPNSYAYFTEEPTDDPLVRKLHFIIQEVEPLADCMTLHDTYFYVPGFDPNMNYIVVDNQGAEHPVVNRTPQMAYRPFIEDGKVWKVGDLSSGNPVQRVEYYYFDGDTVIGGKNCKQMMRQRYVSPDYPGVDTLSQQPSLTNAGAWYEEERKVYAYDSISNQFQLMYDFAIGAGDTLSINNQQYVIGARQAGGLNGFKGVYRTVGVCVDGGSYYSTPWLEGVGSADSPTTNVYPAYMDPMWSLVSCTVGDEVIYLIDGVEDVATPDLMGARKKRFDFTHTIKTRPNAREKTTDAEASGMHSLYGEYNERQLGINLEQLGEAYLIHITNESGIVVYEKAINADNIVALDIDISAYAAGRYTVTLENSRESFTGEFEAQTTGIVDTLRLNDKRGMTSDHIYNLQGQRINTLQKGLNIVNRQKVFVR